MDSDHAEANDRDQEALRNYQESRKRPRSSCSSPSSDCPLDPLQIKKEKTVEPPWKPTESVWLDDPAGLYGIKPEFLRILGIEPPITNWVVVENFRCDKTELREILELAGYVVVCSVIHGHQKNAKVMYTHALEAVQAVSMFNKQIFYGRALSVTMLKYPITNVILPKGLQNIGPGFGIYGKPLKDIVKHFERFVRNEPHTINTCLFHDPNEIKAPSSIETIDSDISKEDVNEKFQFKQFIIRNVEDDNEDSKSETGSKKDNSSTDNKSETKTTSLPKYSPRSPTRSPALTDDNSRSVSPETRLKKLQNSVPTNNLVTIQSVASTPNNTINSSGSMMGPRGLAPNSTMNPSGPMMGPSGGPVPAPNFLTNTLPIPIQGPTMGPNHMSAIGPRFGNNITCPTFGPHPSGMNAMPGPVGPRFGPTVPMVGPNVALGPRIQPGAPMAIPNNVSGLSGPAMRPNVPVMAATSGPNSSGLLPSLPTTLQFRNLPPTTTFPILCEKMAQCGQVMSIQLTTPGCANVVFSHPAHAQRCFQRYNNFIVDGCRIEARII